jgi:hypothetical protein
MKCEDHPFYPKKYCLGCRLRQRPCSVCGEKTSEFMVVEAGIGDGNECIQLEVCAGCYQKLVSVKNGTSITSYKGKLLRFTQGAGA